MLLACILMPAYELNIGRIVHQVCHHDCVSGIASYDGIANEGVLGDVYDADVVVM